MSGDETRAVALAGAAPSEPAARLAAEARRHVDADPGAQLAFAAAGAGLLPRPGEGETVQRWELLATLGAVDLGLARAWEPHADALAILAEAGHPRPPGTTTWGVYAAEGPGVRLLARRDGSGWRLDGTKPWCSLAGRVTHALVTAWVDDDRRGLFAVDLRGTGAQVEDAAWVSRGLTGITSGPVTFTDCPADAVGAPGWYLARDGFAWGGMGVAAVWYGGAVGLARRLRRATLDRPPGDLVLAQLGAVDEALAAARAVLVDAAAAVDAGRAGGAAGERLGRQVRGVVADAAERVLTRVDHALGPGPLTAEEDHARRVADLRVYVRQHHPDREAAALGRSLTQWPGDPW